LTFTPSRILRDGINGKSTILPSKAGESDHDDEEIEDDETGT
jgi:hypothetical protein